MLQFYSHSVGEDPRVDTNLQEGALWKAIIILVRHTWLRVQGPARRKGANDEIPGGRRDEILPQRHHYSGQWLKACPKLVDRSPSAYPGSHQTLPLGACSSLPLSKGRKAS